MGWQEEGGTKSLGVGEKHNHLKLVLKQGKTRDSQQMTLEIEQAFPQLFRVYKFHVESNVGDLDHEVLLERDSSLEVTLGGSSIQVSLLLMGALVAALTAVVQL